ncbi:MAG TPA: SDR family oxidoreductase [Thermoanaerobaculia bacterium]|nr:SDR family oxidoreductase [Thermoanaerobaculia bacterium]
MQPERAMGVPRVIVITGGSSGIGHATALEFARRGDCVAIAARGAEALARAAGEIEAAGGEALAITSDVARFDDVSRIAAETIARFGRIDVWINNASVGEWGTLESLDIATIDRVIAVNLLGTIYGCKAVLPHFRERGRGVIINVASGLAERAIPLLSTYSAAKAGVRGFTESLRMELAAEKSGVDVVLVLPASINTPFYSNGRSRMGVRPHPVAVIYPPQSVAETIVKVAEKPRREVYVGAMAKALSLGQRVSPAAMDAYMLQGGRMFREQSTTTLDGGQSNLFESPNDSRVEGDFTSESRRRSLYTRSIGTRRSVRFALATAAAVTLFAAFRKRR